MDMRKIFMMLAAVLCCAMTMMAQNTQEEALKWAEEKAALADKNPTNGKMQYQAATAYLSDVLAEKKDVDRALTYASRAFKIAQEHPAPQDTLKGLSCYTLATIYMSKQSWENAFDFMEMAGDAFQEELGRNDPVTTGTKLIFGFFMMGMQPHRAFPMIQEAFNDNMMAQQNKRIENMDEASILLELALESLIALHTQTFRYAVPMIFRDGKKYYVVQSKDWNIERPLVGWLVPNMLRSDEEKAAYKGDPNILCDDAGNFIILPEDERPELTYNFRHYMLNPQKLVVNDGDARIWFLNPDGYNRLLADFRAFKNSIK